MIYEVDSVGRLSGPTNELLTPEIFEAILARVADELGSLDAQDFAIDYDNESGAVRIAVAVRAEYPENAVTEGAAIIRTAIHAAGGATPTWSVDLCEASAIRREVLVDA